MQLKWTTTSTELVETKQTLIQTVITAKKTEDKLHLFTTCHRIQNIWKHFQATYQKLTKTIIHQVNTFLHYVKEQLQA